MNMYVWDNFYGTGLEFSPGLAVALASSVAEARELIHKRMITDAQEWAMTHGGSWGNEYDEKHVTKELEKPCMVFASPAAVVNEGGA